jgi:uncharacterized membrane protein
LVDSEFVQNSEFLRIKNTKKNESLEKISLMVFIWFSLLFFLNLQYNLTDGYDEIIFFISSITLFCVIIYQIFFSKVNNFIILFEIFIVYLFLHLIYQVGYSGLRDSDPYIDYNLLKEILTNGHFTFGQDIYGVKGWPILHIFSSINSLLTNIDPLFIAKYLPSFLTSIIVVPIYLLISEIYKNKKIALFSCLLFGSIPQFMNFDSDFIRECLGILIMILFFYILYISKKRNDRRLTILALLLIPVVIFTHHLTSFLTIILLSIYILTSIVVPYLHRKDKQITFSGKINIQTIFLIALFAIISYWIYSATIIVQVFTNTIVPKEEIPISYAARINLGATIQTLKGYIIYYGFYFFNFLFAFLLMIKFIFKKNQQKIEDTAFSLFFFFCMFLGFISLYFMPSIGFPQRFLPYGMMFGLIPLVGILVCLKKDVYKKIIVIFLAFFFIYNLYSIDPANLSGDVNLTGINAGDREYSIAMTIQLPSEYYGYSGLIGVISDIQGIGQRTGGMSIEDLNDLHNISNPIVMNEGIYLFKNIEYTKKRSMESYNKLYEILTLKNQRDINKICDLGNIYIVQKR